MIQVYKLEEAEKGGGGQNKQVDCQLGSVIRRLDGKKHRTRGREGGELRERDEKREPGKKYHLFFRHKEDKNVSIALRGRMLV